MWQMTVKEGKEKRLFLAGMTVLCSIDLVEIQSTQQSTYTNTTCRHLNRWKFQYQDIFALQYSGSIPMVCMSNDASMLSHDS